MYLLANLALITTAAASSIPDFNSKPHIVMVRERATGFCSAACCSRAPLCAPGKAASLARAEQLLLLHHQVVVDDLGWHNVGWHNPDMITPNADQLVAEGMTCAALAWLRPLCASRASAR